jgi:hypothetical protein
MVFLHSTEGWPHLIISLYSGYLLAANGAHLSSARSSSRQSPARSRPAFLGIIRDLTGGYLAVPLACIALEISAAIIVLTGTRLPNLPAA